MKLTLDRMCISTNKLCKTCMKRLEYGEIGEVDIEIGKILMNLGKSNKYLNDLVVVKIIATTTNIYIMVKKGHYDKINKAKDLIKEKLGSYDKRVLHVFEKTKTAKVLLDNIMSPIKLISCSTVIMPPDGVKEIKLKMKKQYRNELYFTSDEISSLTTAILGMKTHYVFE